MVFFRTIAAIVIPVIVFIGASLLISPSDTIPFAYGQEDCDNNPDTPLPDCEIEGGGGTPNSIELANPLKVNSVEGLILAVIDVVLIFLIPVIVLYIMYAGFLFVKAQGNPAGISEAKRALVTALIGGVIILGARAILDVVRGTIEAIRSDSAASDHNIPYA